MRKHYFTYYGQEIGLKKEEKILFNYMDKNNIKQHIQYDWCFS